MASHVRGGLSRTVAAFDELDGYGVFRDEMAPMRN